MSWMSLITALAFLVVATHVSSLPASPSNRSPEQPKDEERSVSLRQTSVEVVAPCQSTDRACQFLLSVRFLDSIEGEPARAPLVPPQTPADTLRRRTGDPEAKALLLASLLDHQGIAPYLLYAMPKVYVLTCDVGQADLENAVRRYLPTGVAAAVDDSADVAMRRQDSYAFRIGERPCVLVDPASHQLPGTPVMRSTPLRHAVGMDGTVVEFSS